MQYKTRLYKRIQNNVMKLITFIITLNDIQYNTINNKINIIERFDILCGM